MSNLFKRLAAVIVAATVLVGCTATNMGAKQGIGTLAGAVGGAVVGSNVGKGKGNMAAIAAGTLIGAFIGSEIGASLDAADRTALQSAQYNALETASTGQQVAWRNPDSGNYGYVTPTQTYTPPSPSMGQVCREYQQTIYVGGQAQTAHGTACRQPDGSWKIVNA